MATTSSSSALDLLRPDPPVDKPEVAEKEPEEEDELEALRQAAIASMMKPKAPAYKVQAHPNRSNLLCIVVEDQKKPEKPLKSVRELMGNGAAGQLNPPKIQSGSPRRDKFNRYESGSDKDESEEEEEEIETETEVEVTDSENEAEAEAVDQQKDKSDVLSTSAMKDDEDVLNVDCRDEVDEFSKFLNECETELNDSTATDASKSATGGKTKKTKIIKKKKIVKRIVKKGRSTSKLDVSTSEKEDKTHSISAPRQDSRRSRTISRSPSPLSRYGRRYSRSPMSPYRRSPPRRRSRSPYRRGLSPYSSRRPYSPPQYRYGPSGTPPYRPGSPPPFYRRNSPPPYRRGSPPGQYKRYGSPHRRIRSPRGSSIRFEKNTISRRGGSAPRTTPGDGEVQQRTGEDKVKDGTQSGEGVDVVTKSKSLPPPKKPDNRSAARIAREEEERKMAEEKEEQKRLEFEERLKRLSSPDREKVLARRRKFENSQALVKPEKKVISLKTDSSSSSAPIPLPLEAANAKSDRVAVPAKKVKRLISEDQGDAISLSVDDTLDMFEEAEDSSKFQRGPVASRIGKREPEPPSKSITDLRVQLYKKRQQKRDSDFDDSLENAVIESSDDVDDGDTVRTALSGNRIVKPPTRDIDRRIGVSTSNTKLSKSRSNSPIRSTKFVVRNVSPKATSLRPSMIARLGDQVAEEDIRQYDEPEVEASRKRKKTNSTGRSESPTSGDDKTSVKISKKEKKKEKKEKEKKKKSKKDKKEKREKRKKRKSKVSDDEDDDDSPDEENNRPPIDVDAEPEASKAGNSSDDDELWGFFENMDKAVATSPDVHPTTDKTDILMDKMRKKNEARLKRIKEIEEDRMKYK